MEIILKILYTIGSGSWPEKCIMEKRNTILSLLNIFLKCNAVF